MKNDESRKKSEARRKKQEDPLLTSGSGGWSLALVLLAFWLQPTWPGSWCLLVLAADWSAVPGLVQSAGVRLARSGPGGVVASFEAKFWCVQRSYLQRSVQRRIFLRIGGLVDQVHPKFWGLIGYSFCFGFFFVWHNCEQRAHTRGFNCFFVWCS